ncbi:MAG: cobaltochelatase subunit CobN, partial [Rhodobacteraceae bacterium]|nr:cobaltochelatase subunit CobN [Paracoccaceae bacterium]
MHVIFRESHGLDETDTPQDLGQSPADLVVLSFSDSDLGAFASGWHRGNGPTGGLPSLRLANLVALKHPLSVDTYVDQTLQGAKGILIRLIGGVPYWAYGLQQVRALADAKGIALAVLPADGREDPRLDDVSTLPVSTLRRLAHLCDTGGAIAAQAALAQMALATGLYAGPVPGSKALPAYGAWSPERGVYTPQIPDGSDRPRVLVSFYRSYLVAADTAPIDALISTFKAKGYDVRALFAPSLKAPDAAEWLRDQIVAYGPDVIVNATSFSGRGATGQSPLDAGNVPVFQVSLSTARRKDWAGSERGLSPADLAMHVVLPEVDGRIMGGVVSFKEPGKRDAHLEYSRFGHRADAERIDSLAARVDGWMRLGQKPVDQRRPALVLSTYPGKDWNMGHAVGLDAPASAKAILQDLGEAGYKVDRAPKDLPGALLHRDAIWPIADYRAALAHLPDGLRDDLDRAWGAPEDDPDTQDGMFRFAVLRSQNALVALQPERGLPKLRSDEYHDLGRVPRHAYVAFYLWLQTQADALIHIGAHGTLEWLPGKSVALSQQCWPEVLVGDLPVIYPFIVNDPGEAAQAKRRIGAVTLGHIPPPLKQAGTPERLVRLEAFLDEFSNADGLDPKRRDRLQADIRSEAQALGLEEDLGLDRASCSAEAITRIDRFVCDIKESQFGEGLHIWGRPARPGSPFDTDSSVAAERQALLEALDGKRIAAGPS